MEIPDDVKRHWQVLDEIETQTDRGTAIIGAAYLEERLTEVIRSRFVAGNEPEQDLLASTGALGTFAAKIDLAYALGMVGAKTYRDLHLIRKIRNDFAHVVEPLSFSHRKVTDRCKELYISANMLMPRQHEPPSDPRDRYLATILIIFNLLWGEMCKKQGTTEPAVNTP